MQGEEEQVRKDRGGVQVTARQWHTGLRAAASAAQPPGIQTVRSLLCDPGLVT